ncbi:HIT family protein [Frankia sp. AgB32]|uniref:HIT family protein n=1 Tax=Frankia sp. AgB32 TaxID=631119 RepID=UPI00200D653C|nr:HIT family protein [Frankia sp. AgB32]MCK9894049.1 HIT family protein [Frankia sp. AgB32]
MPSVFTRIINGELPGRIVHADEHTVALLTIAPIRPGHTLVVPRVEIDRWLDLPDDVHAALWASSALVGRAIDRAFGPRRVAVIVAGLEVPHAHVHLIPIDSEKQLSFENADQAPDPAALDDAAERIRAALA